MGETSIETIEHCMPALAGLRVDNVLVQLDGPELPCGDGSAAPFVEPMLEVGMVTQDAPRRIHRITAPILVQAGDALLSVFPGPPPSPGCCRRFSPAP